MLCQEKPLGGPLKYSPWNYQKLTLDFMKFKDWNIKYGKWNSDKPHTHTFSTPFITSYLHCFPYICSKPSNLHVYIWLNDMKLDTFEAQVPVLEVGQTVQADLFCGASQIIFFCKQGLWQPCIEQVYQCHFFQQHLFISCLWVTVC